MTLQATEILSILKQEIAGLDTAPQVSEIGRVISVGDGIAKVWGLEKVQSGEMVVFGDNIFG
ncbi:MAG: F0F1 ATP synthase subunit alpha, partial [Holosporales bacterium]